MKNGELVENGSARYCTGCIRTHGFLYVCPSYDENLQKLIKSQGDEFKKLCISGEIKIKINGETKTYNHWIRDHMS